MTRNFKITLVIATLVASGLGLYSLKSENAHINIAYNLQARVDTTIEADRFSDVASDHENRDAIDYLQRRGVVKGSEAGTFNPDNTVTRCEILKIILEGLGQDLAISGAPRRLPDVPADHWCAKYLAKALEMGWVKGYSDGTFKPNNPVTNIEALKMLVNAAKLRLPGTLDANPFKGVDKSQWYAAYLELAKQLNLFEYAAGQNYAAGAPLKRSTMAEMIFRVMAILQTGQDFFAENIRDQLLAQADLKAQLIQNEAQLLNAINPMRALLGTKDLEVKVAAKGTAWRNASLNFKLKKVDPASEKEFDVLLEDRSPVTKSNTLLLARFDIPSEAKYIGLYNLYVNDLMLKQAFAVVVETDRKPVHKCADPAALAIIPAGLVCQDNCHTLGKDFTCNAVTCTCQKKQTSCIDNTVDVKVKGAKNAFKKGMACRDDCKTKLGANAACNPDTCLCDVIKPGGPTLGCSMNTFASLFGVSFMGPGVACLDDCAPNETCDATSCTCKPRGGNVSCTDNSRAALNPFGAGNPFVKGVNTCQDDCARLGFNLFGGGATHTCDPNSCVCKEKVKCSTAKIQPGILGIGGFNPAAQVCQDDCPPTETCNANTCTCEKKQRLTSCASNTTSGGSQHQAGNVCRDDCDSIGLDFLGDVYCDQRDCMCKFKQKEISCASSEGRDLISFTGAGVCKDDCPSTMTCNQLTCQCEKKQEPKRVKCSAPDSDKQFNKGFDVCEDNCDDGFYCNADCSCERQEYANCAGTRTRSFDPKVDICNDNCPEGTYCTDDCSCKEKEKEVRGCLENTLGVNTGSDNPFNSKSMSCMDNCPSGTTCSSDCVCVEKQQPKKQIGCWENTEEVDQTDRNFFSSDAAVCIDTCRAGYECNVGSCTCTKKRTTTTVIEEPIETELVDLNLTGNQPIEPITEEPVQRPPLDCKAECGKQGMVFGQPDYTAAVQAKLNPHSCVSGASIRIQTATITNSATGESCQCFVEPSQVQVDIDMTPSVCKGTPCGDVACGSSNSCSCGENCIQTVSCNWNGWKVGNLGTTATPIIGGE